MKQDQISYEEHLVLGFMRRFMHQWKLELALKRVRVRELVVTPVVCVLRSDQIMTLRRWGVWV